MNVVFLYVQEEGMGLGNIEAVSAVFTTGSCEELSALSSRYYILWFTSVSLLNELLHSAKLFLPDSRLVLNLTSK